MKKIDILNMINANNVIENNKNLLSTIKEKMHNSYYYKEEKFWFPDISELNNYFEVLKKELKEAKEKTLASETFIKKTECTHEVRLKYRSTFSSLNKCVLCGHIASSDNVMNFSESIYRNKHTVTFDAKYQENEDVYYEIKTGKTNSEVRDLIIEILKKCKDDDEVDLVEEFSKLNLNNVEINLEKRKKENYILIIGGTNLEYIDKQKKIYLTKSLQLNSDEFISYFSGLLNTRIAIIDRKELLDNKIIKMIEDDHKKMSLYDYTTIDDLDCIFYQLKDISFKLIIDVSEMYNYEINNGRIENKIYDLNLKDKFPNTHIVKISNLTDIESLKKIKELLISYKSNLDTIVASDIQGSKKYYYLENDELKQNEFDDACNHIKRLLIK